MDRLARFTDVTIPTRRPSAAARPADTSALRVATVAYGYLGVVEEYENPDHGTVMVPADVSLPGLAPNLVVDHRTAFGLPGVPAGDVDRGTGDGDFEPSYGVAAETRSRSSTRSSTAELARPLVAQPGPAAAALRDATMLLRTFDGSDASETSSSG